MHNSGVLAGDQISSQLVLFRSRPYFEGAPRPTTGPKRIPTSRLERLTSSLRKQTTAQLLVTRSTS